MALRKTPEQKATRKAIMKKVNRKNNPVTSLVQLAEEFGAPVHGPYYIGNEQASGRTASRSFREHVASTVGTLHYKQIRSNSHVR